MTDALTAAKAIQQRHRTVISGVGVECGCAEGCEGQFPCHDNLDAGVVLAQLNEAITISEDAHLRHHHHTADGRCIWCGHDWPCADYTGATATLACLAGDKPDA